MAWEGILVGYSTQSPEWIILDPRSNRLRNAYSVTFNENVRGLQTVQADQLNESNIIDLNGESNNNGLNDVKTTVPEQDHKQRPSPENKDPKEQEPTTEHSSEDERENEDEPVTASTPMQVIGDTVPFLREGAHHHAGHVPRGL